MENIFFFSNSQFLNYALFFSLEIIYYVVLFVFFFFWTIIYNNSKCFMLNMREKEKSERERELAPFFRFRCFSSSQLFILRMWVWVGSAHRYTRAQLSFRDDKLQSGIKPSSQVGAAFCDTQTKRNALRLEFQYRSHWRGQQLVGASVSTRGSIANVSTTGGMCRAETQQCRRETSMSQAVVLFALLCFCAQIKITRNRESCKNEKRRDD